MHKVFVYGSLKMGHGNHFLLEENDDSRFVAATQTKESIFRMFSLGMFPAVKFDYRDGFAIQGELYEVSDETLRSLDCLEGHPRLYKREEVKLDTGDTAWIYLMDDFFHDSNLRVDTIQVNDKLCHVWAHF